MPIKETAFREYDIRGKVDSELMVDEMYELGQAIAVYFSENIPHIKTIALGMDGRTHSPQIKEIISRALLDSGIDVLFCGLCPSPVLYFAMYTLHVDAGIMITASHNPREYNGLKVCLGRHLVYGKEIREIYKLFQSHEKLKYNKKGSYREIELVNDYVDWLADHFSHLKRMDRSFIIDCANAVGGIVLPRLIEKMNWSNISLLFEEVDGTYPNHTADPTVEKNMREVKKNLLTSDIECGFGLDGDCDRMAAMTKEGYLVPGDKMLALFASDILQANPGRAVAFDIKASSGLIELLEMWGGVPAMARTGHAFIQEAMRNYDAILGGELSCHFFFNDRYFGYDDGIYALMRTFEILEKTGKTLSELITIFPEKWSSAEIRIKCCVEKMHKVLAELKHKFTGRSDASLITLDGVRATTPYGWGIARASNTQPVLSLRFEADSPEELVHIKRDFIEVLRNHLDEMLLQTEIMEEKEAS